MKILKLCFILGLGGCCLLGAFDRRYITFTGGVDLLFHEAGHVIFGIFGRTLGIAGGTLMQLLIPAGLMVAFLRKGQKYSAAVMKVWLAENFFHISDYIKDARIMIKPFVGGEIHDWNYLLSQMNMLRHDQTLGYLAWAAGFIVLLTAIGQGCYACILEAKEK
jgi:hypothetical protein